MNGEAPTEPVNEAGPTLEEDLEAVRFVLLKPWSSSKRFALAEVAFNRLEQRVRATPTEGE